MMNHTDDCTGDAECTPIRGDWNQPPEWAVSDAKDRLVDDAAWCRIHQLASQLVEEDEGE